MIVRIDVQPHLNTDPYWQLARCQVQRGDIMEDVMNPTSFSSLRFNRLTRAIRHAKSLTFAYLEMTRHTAMPETIEWRVFEDCKIVPCPLCREPMFRIVKLGRRGGCLDLKEWGCPGCWRPVTTPAGGTQLAGRADLVKPRVA